MTQTVDARFSVRTQNQMQYSLKTHSLWEVCIADVLDRKKPLILATDASSYGISAVLSHRCEDKSERPIAYYSGSPVPSVPNTVLSMYSTHSVPKVLFPPIKIHRADL